MPIRVRVRVRVRVRRPPVRGRYAD